MALNREAIRDRLMEEASFPSGHIVPPSPRADDPGFALQPHDPEGAKRLLAEAGYPDGFRVILAAPNDRFSNDEEITRTVAQMPTRIGVQAGVEAMPMAVYGTRGAKRFGIGLIGWGAQTGERPTSTFRSRSSGRVLSCLDGRPVLGPRRRPNRRRRPRSSVTSAEP